MNANKALYARCFICEIDSHQERLVPATLAIGKDEFSVHNHNQKRNRHVCLPCGAKVKTITDAFNIKK